MVRDIVCVTYHIWLRVASAETSVAALSLYVYIGGPKIFLKDHSPSYGYHFRKHVHLHGFHCVTCTSPLPRQEHVIQTASLKTRVNSSYQQAIDLYTQAIQVSPLPEPVFCSNRAASPSRLPDTHLTLIPFAGYMNMSPPQCERVVADCDDAIRHQGTQCACGRFRVLAPL